jgi:hypothetical protein
MTQDEKRDLITQAERKLTARIGKTVYPARIAGTQSRFAALIAIINGVAVPCGEVAWPTVRHCLDTDHPVIV